MKSKLTIVGLALVASLSALQAQTQITLPAPIVREAFDSVDEGKLPAGWRVENFTSDGIPGEDLNEPRSDSYKDWVVISRERVLAIGAAGGWEAARRLNGAPNQLVNGVRMTNLVEGKFIYAESDVRGGSQVQYLFTPDFSLTGKTNVHLSFHSIYEQNQDSIGAVEYSIDEGKTWLPIIYMIDNPDIVRNADGSVSAFATLDQPHGDAARYSDPVTGEEVGGRFGAFIGVATNQWPTLGPFISGRVNDDSTESKRVELFRLAAADNQAKVRFRFAQAGTGSWYFGIDNFGLYSISSQKLGTPTISGPATVSFLSEITLSSSAFAPSVATQTHGSSVWQISASPSFSPEKGLASVLESYTGTSVLTSLIAQLGRVVPGETYYATVQHQDQAGGKSDFAAPISFKVEPLPPPFLLENFETVNEGSLPRGWTVTNQTDGGGVGLDPASLGSDTYLDWAVVAFETMQTFGGNRVNNTNVISGKSIYAESDTRSGNQIQYLFTPDFDLTGKSNVWVSFKSNYIQNQDSMGVLEYSVDAGATWRPLNYMIDRPDVLLKADGTIDAVATLETTYGDVAKVFDPATGDRVAAGKYGDFVLARPLSSLGPFISGRVNDDISESKRIERFRLAGADNQSKVRFRFVQAGTGSWFWGVDDFGLYVGAPAGGTPPAGPAITVAPQGITVAPGANVTLSVVATGTPPLTFQWKVNGTDIPGATSNTLTLNSIAAAGAGSYTVTVSNAAGSTTSPAAVVVVNVPSATPTSTYSQWDFDNGDLSATVGAALEYRGNTAAGTTYTTVDIGGQQAKVMKFPASTRDQGYLMTHGLAANGGGTNVNQYTLIMDLMFPAESHGKWRGLFQTDPTNVSDGDLFVNTANGIGISGQYQGTIQPNTWHRVVFAFDLTAKTLGKYIDGQSVNLQTLSATAGGVDQRWSLVPTALLFTDEDGETSAGFVNSIQIRNRRLSDVEIAALGSATASGIPNLDVTGQWDFENGDLAATVGAPLEYRGDVAAGTTFSTATIGGQPAKVMAFPATTKAQGYVMTHGAAPNGGGTNVNQYTLIMDLMFPQESHAKWRGLFQTDPSNVSDGDLFVNTSNGIGISGQYHGSILANTWHRVAFAFDLTAKTLGKYIDGQLVNLQTLSATSGGVDQRWSLAPAALLFADEDGETSAGFVNSIQIRNRRLSDAEIAALGSAAAGGIPFLIQAPSGGIRITKITSGANSLTLEWSGGTPPFLVRKKSAVTDPAWTTVATTTERTATIAREGSSGFLQVGGGIETPLSSFTAKLSGAAERPAPVTSTGTGTGSLSLDGDKLTFHISYSGLSGSATAAHIHGPATVEEAAGVLVNLAPFNGGAFGVSGTLSGTVTLTAEQKTHLLAGKTYVNIHTAANNGGEIRGQIVR